MTKQLFVLVALCSGGALFAKTAANQLIDFNTMEEGHKKSWLNLIEKDVTLRLELMKKHDHECVALQNKHITQFAKSIDRSATGIEKRMMQKLADKIELHKKQCDDWNNYTDNRYNDVKKLAEKEQNELLNFEESL